MVLATTLRIAEPFDMHRTLRMLEVGGRADDGTWWWASHTELGIGTLCISRTIGGVEATAWGDGAPLLMDRLPALMGADDASQLVDIPERAAPILRETRGVRLGATGDVHAALVKAVLGQVVTTKEASTSLRGLTSAHGQIAPGPRLLRTGPSSDVLSHLTYEELHRFGIERRRAGILIEVSRRAKRMNEILSMQKSAAYERLMAVRGIGEWSAGSVMGPAWGDKDAVPVGDYHIRNDVAWVLAGRDRGTDDDMLKLLEPFRPERRRLLVAIKLEGVHAPRYGPKTAIRRHL